MRVIKILPLLTSIAITGCFHKSKQNTTKETYGVFLGASSKDTKKLLNYDNVVIDIDEFKLKDIKTLKDNNVSIYSYLSIGSLETYRDYYEEYKDYTFMDYDNWPDERWIDVSQSSWQDLLISEANRMKSLGADGLFMDNFDVYYIVMEEYDCSDKFKEDIYNGCLTILDDLSKTDLKLMINSGTDFLERMNEEINPLIQEIDVYAQECVFSSIIDYEKDVFDKQDNETKEYYQSIIEMMEYYSDILLIEYTKDKALIEEIKSYCLNNNYHYYISSKVNLEA